MSGHYPIAQGDPLALLLGIALALFIVGVVAGMTWFLWPAIRGESA